jgi:hypothetical protein
MWFNPYPLTVSSPYAPALALHGGKLHMVYADGGGQLHHGVFTSAGVQGSWAFSSIAGKSTPLAPALVDYRGILTCAYRPTNTSVIQTTTLDDSTNTWSHDLPTSMVTAYPVSLAVHNGLVYAAFVDARSHVSYATWDGHLWSNGESVNGVLAPTSGSAALVSYRGQLHLLFTQSGSVAHYFFSGPVVPNQAWLPLGATGLTNAAEVAAVEFNAMLCTFVRYGNRNLVTAAFDGAGWSILDTPIGTNAFSGPAAAVLGNTIQVLYEPLARQMSQIVGVTGGTAPLSRIPLCSLAGTASVQTGVPYAMFGGQSPYTVEAWVNLSTIGGGTQYIVSSFDAAANSGLMALAVVDGQFAAYRNGEWLTSVTTPEPDVWYHVAAVYDGGAYLYLYVNGNLEGTEINNQPANPQSTGRVLIGAASNGPPGSTATGLLQGTVRWVAIWNVARDTNDVSSDLYFEPAPQPGLMALYDFSGAAPRDVSGHALAATVTGTVRTIAETQGLGLVGTNGLDCGVGSTLSFASNQAMSAEAWVRPTAVPSGEVYILERSGEYSLGMNGLHWTGSIGGTTLQSTSARPTVSQWTHVAVTWSPSGTSGMATLYVNGVQQVTASAHAASNVIPTTIGCTLSGAQGFTGCIASVRLWSKALSETEVLAAMTQSPLGMDGLAANYDFSTSPPLDATLANDAPTTIGAAAEGYVVEPISNVEADQMVTVKTDVSIPYYPDGPSVPPPARARRKPVHRVGGPRTVDEILTPSYRESLLATFDRSLPPGVSEAVRKDLTGRHALDLERLFLAARANPRGGLGGHRFEWTYRGDLAVLLHHRPDGETVEVGSVMAVSFTPQELWWIQFTITLVLGFASILGLATPSSLATKLLEYITDNEEILLAVEASVDIATDITPQVIYNTLQHLWEGKFLLGLIKLIAISLSWWALAKLAVRLAAMLVPGADELEVATMLVTLAFLAVQLSLLALQYPESAASFLPVGASGKAARLDHATGA